MPANRHSAPLACVFDVYGTLLDVSGAVRQMRERLGERAERLDELWRRKQLEYSWLTSLMQRPADFDAVTRAALDHALAALEIREPDLREALLSAYLALPPFAEVPGVLEALRQRGLRLAVLSNGTRRMLERALGRAGLLDRFEAVVSVEEVGVFKPAPEVYAQACARLGLGREAILFLSANAWDAHGAASFGLRSLWVNRRGLAPERLAGELAGEVRDLTGALAWLERCSAGA